MIVSKVESTQTIERRIPLADKLFTILVVISPILRQYSLGISSINLADFFFIVTGLIYIKSFIYKVNFRKNSLLLWFWFLGLCLTFVSQLIQQPIGPIIFARLVRYSFYIYIIVVASEHFNLKCALKSLKFVSTAISIYIIAQSISFNYFGYVLGYKVLPVSLFREVSVEQIAVAASKKFLRPAGVFVEPGYAAHFLFIALIFSLYGWNTSKKMNGFSTLLIFTATILTTSTQGFFISIFIIAVFLLKEMRKRGKRKYLWVLVFVLIITVVLVYGIMDIDIVEKSINKVTESVQPGGSAALRLYRGWAVFQEMPLQYKILGVGHGCLGDYVIEHSIRTAYDPTVITKSVAYYTNGASSVLLYYGVLGFLWFGVLMLSFLKNTQGPYRMITFTYLIMMFIGGGMFNIIMVYYFSFMYAGYKHSSKFILSNELALRKEIIIPMGAHDEV